MVTARLEWDRGLEAVLEPARPVQEQQPPPEAPYARGPHQRQQTSLRMAALEPL